MLERICALTSPRIVTRLAVVLVCLIAAPAYATWSIILINIRTGEIAVGSATCLSSFDLKAGTPVLIPGFGAVTAQSFVDITGQNRVFARDQLVMRTDPQTILDLLRQFDTGHETRQYGIVDTLGRTATFSGLQASQWKGGVTGVFSTPDGDVAYAIQGNILTGEPVVTAAEQAVMNTPGDLAERMMAGMEAARSMGGDGRCSCNLAPTACGSPPPNFTKSAHIAYMLISRTGDMPGCNGLYRAPRVPWDVATGDLDGDGRPDAVVIATSVSEVSVLFNATEPGSPFVIFEQAVALPSRRARDVKLADVNNDGILDIITANASDGSVSVLIGRGDRTFETPVVIPAGPGPDHIIVADLDGQNGPDIAALSASSLSIALLMNDGLGGFTPGGTITLAERPGALVAGDADGDGDIDLLLPILTLDIVQILDNDAAGGFTVGATVATAIGPNSIAVDDLDHDLDLDIVVGTTTSNVVTVLLREGAAYLRTDLPLGSRAINVSIGEANGDGNKDLIVFRSSTTLDLQIFRGDGTGGFVPEGAFTARYNIARWTVDDLNGDGLDDIAAGSRTSMTIIENVGQVGGPITYTDGQGCAQGDWFMDFNIAFQTQASPDPVFQLMDLLALWRSDLVGRPDAVRSRVTFSSPVLRAPHASFGGDVETMRIELLDWEGNPITVPLLAPPQVT
ncbi:MAG: VCBS repeat-containing protein, partial [Planctomycetes bacterium]|nr:VCBS repeat-containing protein [Planctomycetota bacterium]